MAFATLGEVNRNYWNANADGVFTQQWVQDLGHQITDYIQNHVDWIGIPSATANTPVTMLDYACGNGLASTALAPYVTNIRGIDVSDTMVERYNEAARKQGLSEEQMHAIRGDLMVPQEEIPEDLKTKDLYDFDVIVMSMALHHFEHPQKIVERLVERLGDGGSLLIMDWAPSLEVHSDLNHNHNHHHDHGHGHDHEKHVNDGEYKQDSQQAQKTIKRSGFDKEEMSRIFKEAGCREWDYVHYPELSKLPSNFGGDKQLFFARGKNVESMLPNIAATIAERTSKTPAKIDLATAENWLLRPELLEICKEAINQNLTEDNFSYPRGFGGEPNALAALASFFNTYFYPQIPVEPNHIVITPGASSCLDTLLYNICDDGDSVLVPTPYWNGFDHHFHFRSSVVIIPVYPPPSHKVTEIRRLTETLTTNLISALSHEYSSHPDPSRIKALVLTNPHNPFSLCYTASILRRCMSWCHERSIHFVSDEMYALSTVSSQIGNTSVVPFVSALKVAGMKQEDVEKHGCTTEEIINVDYSRTHVLWGLSKDFATSGVRMGCIVTQNSALRTGMALLNSTTVSSLTTIFTTSLLRSRRLPALIALNSARLTSSFNIVRSYLERWDVEFIPPTAGLYVFARLGKHSMTDEMEDSMLKRLNKAGVLVAGGKTFKMKELGKGWVRITFSTTERVLVEGLQRIERCLFDGSVLTNGNKRKMCGVQEDLSEIEMLNKRTRVK